MNRRAIAILAAVIVTVPVLATVPGTGSTASSTFKAGAAKADITPPVGTSGWGYTDREVVLATGEDLGEGTFPPRWLDQRDDGVDTEQYGKTFLKTEGVHTRLYANAHVLDDGQDQLAFVLADLGGIPGELHQAVVDRLADDGVPIEQHELMLGATHTHGGPGEIFQYQGYALLGGGEFDARVFGLVADQIAKAVAQAYDARVPATVALGQADLSGATHNRATAAHTAVHDQDDDHVDETARVIRVDETDGTPIGLISVFAAHGVVIGSDDMFFSGDNQGIAARLIAQGIAENATGISSPHDVVVTYLNGAEGDISPDRPGQGFNESVVNAGKLQADPVLETWSSLAGTGTSDVDLDARSKFLCFCGQPVEYDGETRFISTIPILGAGGTDPFPGVGIPGHDPKVPLLIGPGLVPNVVRFQVARINDHVLATIPGEPTMALGEAIEEEIGALSGDAVTPSTVDVVGLANDYISYMTQVGEYDVQEYEGTFTLYGRMTGPLFEQTMVDMAQALVDGAPLDPGWQGVVEHPDTATPSTGQVDLTPDATPAVVSQPAGSVGAGDIVSFSWLGGSPAVDHPVDEVMVRLVDSQGDTVLDDRGFRLFVWYDKDGVDEHRWRVDHRIDGTLAPGDYSFEVTGQHVGPTGQVLGYTVSSDPFTVTS